jgi:hypothetical protein
MKTSRERRAHAMDAIRNVEQGGKADDFEDQYGKKDDKGKISGRRNQAILVQQPDGTQYHAKLRNLIGEWDDVIREQLEITKAKDEKSSALAIQRELRHRYEVEVREPALEKLYNALVVIDPVLTMDQLWSLPDETVQYLAQKVTA